MTDTTEATLELTPRQQELLLRGLKFVRSSVSLNMQIPTDDVEAERRSEYAELDDLEQKLDASRPTKPR